jgi:hypothetical protein
VGNSSEHLSHTSARLSGFDIGFKVSPKEK